MTPRSLPNSTTVLLAVWLATTALGFALFEAYHAQPNDPGSPSRWPVGGPIGLDPARPTLVLFVHPLCPCSKASVADLASIGSELLGRFAPHVVVYRPLHRSDEWERSAPTLDAASLAGWRRWDDRGAALARRFGVRTSGHLLVFDPHGELLYSGGVTPGRGRRGPSGGLAAFLNGIAGGTIGVDRGPVFGCSMEASVLGPEAGGSR